MEKGSVRATHLTSITSTLPVSPLPPPSPCTQRLLGSGSCDPPWASSTLTNDDNILNWSGSPISGTQTQISGSSPVKRAPGTLPRLPNLNQQRSRENDRAWDRRCDQPPSTSARQLPHPHPLLYLFPSVCARLCYSYLHLLFFSMWQDVMKNNIEEQW